MKKDSSSNFEETATPTDGGTDRHVKKKVKESIFNLLLDSQIYLLFDFFR